jgi:hypothetical protein
MNVTTLSPSLAHISCTTKDLWMMDSPSGCTTMIPQPTRTTGITSRTSARDGLELDIQVPPKKLIFMDMPIRIERERLVTTIYAKPMVPYQYILPNSCHPPCILTGLVFGQILQIYQLFSLSQDINKELSLFYNTSKIAATHQKNYCHSSTKALMMQSPIYPSLRNNGKLGRRPRSDDWMNESSSTSPYYPQNPSSGFIQSLWKNLIFLQPGQEELTKLTNHNCYHVPIKRLIVAYHRNPNLANLNLYRKLSTRTGLKPSMFITQTT